MLNFVKKLQQLQSASGANLTDHQADWGWWQMGRSFVMSYGNNNYFNGVEQSKAL